MVAAIAPIDIVATMSAASQTQGLPARSASDVGVMASQTSTVYQY